MGLNEAALHGDALSPPRARRLSLVFLFPASCMRARAAPKEGRTRRARAREAKIRDGWTEAPCARRARRGDDAEGRTGRGRAAAPPLHEVKRKDGRAVRLLFWRVKEYSTYMSSKRVQEWSISSAVTATVAVHYEIGVSRPAAMVPLELAGAVHADSGCARLHMMLYSVALLS